MYVKQDRSGRSFTSISVDIDTYTKLAEIARKEERSVSWVVKRLVRDVEQKEQKE
jgi:predicted CopG family antitoxin